MVISTEMGHTNFVAVQEQQKPRHLGRAHLRPRNTGGKMNTEDLLSFRTPSLSFLAKGVPQTNVGAFHLPDCWDHHPLPNRTDHDLSVIPLPVTEKSSRNCRGGLSFCTSQAKHLAIAQDVLPIFLTPISIAHSFPGADKCHLAHDMANRSDWTACPQVVTPKTKQKKN